MTDALQQLIKQFMPFAQERFSFEEPPRLFLKDDETNAKDPLGKTAYYDPHERSITLYITGRHPKDILRSLGHELVHHKQNCCGMFDDAGPTKDGYAQSDPHLRQMEIEANRDGSMCLRDFEDMLKKENTTYYEHLQKGEISNMSTKDWKNKEISTLLSEAWGFKFNSLQEFDAFNGTGELQEEGDEVQEEGVLDSGAGMGVAGALMDDDEELEEACDDEELEEQSRTDRPDRAAGRDTSGRRLDEEDDEKDDDDDTKDDTKDDVPAFLKKEELQERIATLLTKYIKG